MDTNTTIYKRCIVGQNIECWLGSFVTFQGIRTRIAKKPYIFAIFQGGGGWIRPSVLLAGPSKIIALSELMLSLGLTRMSYVFVS